VLTRTRILEHVWDFAYEGMSNVVDQYVLYLRRKIDRPFGVAQLETVRGAGYRLRERPEPLAPAGDARRGAGADRLEA
jgi:two-component system OmpR family response regulator